MKKILQVCLIFICSGIYAQDADINKLIPNTPSTSKIEKILSPQVNEFKGVADIKIPIYNINSDGVDVPIYLIYDSSGIKVEEEASWIGQSWSLITGAMVSRNQIGVPDDIKTNIGMVFTLLYTLNPAYGYVPGAPQYFNSTCVTAQMYQDCGWFYSNQNVQDIVNSMSLGGTSYSDAAKAQFQGINAGAKDNAPDIFNVFLPNGVSEKFFFETANKINFFDKNSTNINYYIDDVNKGINRFLVKDSNGVSYDFKNAEYLGYRRDITNTNIREGFAHQAYTYSTYHDAQFNSSQIFSFWSTVAQSMCSSYSNPETQEIVNRLWPKAWQISTIKSVGGKEIKYNYVDENYYSLSNTFIKRDLYPSTVSISSGNDIQQGIQPRLESITWDEGKIVFVPGSIREDVYNKPNVGIQASLKTLDKIEIYDSHDKLIKQFIFNYSYKLAEGYNISLETSVQSLYKRLYLNSIEINDQAKVNIGKYSFNYNENPLPNKFSFEQDYWGYYNNNDANTLWPNLWWYPSEQRDFIDKGAFSIYPRPTYVGEQKRLSDYIATQSFPASYNANAADRRPNSLYTKNGILEKITYPTGGQLILEYEQNKFLYRGINVDGPGLRVTTTTLKKDANDLNPSITNYIYEENGLTTGRIRELPVFTGLGRYDKEASKNPLYYISSYPLNQFNVVYNSDFGYTKVEKKYFNNALGKEVKTFSAPLTLGGTILNDSFGKNIFTTAINSTTSRATYVTSYYGSPGETLNFHDYFPYPNESNLGVYFGKPLQTKTYDTSGNILEEKTFTYSDGSANNFVKAYFTYPGEGSSIISYLSSSYQLTGDENKQNSGAISLISKKTFTYNNFRQLTSESLINSKNQKITTYYKYPSDYNLNLKYIVDCVAYRKQCEIDNKYKCGTDQSCFNAWCSCQTENNYYLNGFAQVLKSMVDRNMLFPIEIKQTINNNGTEKVISSALTEYRYDNTNIVKSKISNLDKTDNAFQDSYLKDNKPFLDFISSPNYTESVLFQNYYPNGNIKEVSKKDGTHTVYIWGYNQSKIVAKIENATASEVEQYITNIQNYSNGTDEQLLITELNKLRTNLSKAMITTYTHTPLVGVSTITDPKGDMIIYLYDNSGRLEFVKDAQGNIISENKYHYKN